MIKTKRIRNKSIKNKYKKKLTKKRKKLIKDDMVGGFIPASIYSAVNGLYLDFNDSLKSDYCKTCYRKYMTHPNIWKNENKIKNYEDLDLIKYLPVTEEFFRFGHNNVIEECGKCGANFKVIFKGMFFPPLAKEIYKFLLMNKTEINHVSDIIKSTAKKNFGENFDEIFDNINIKNKIGENLGENVGENLGENVGEIVSKNVESVKESAKKSAKESANKSANKIKSKIKSKIPRRKKNKK